MPKGPQQVSSPPAYAALMADPLNAELVGRPDSNSWPTNTVRIKDVHQVLSSAAGEVAVYVSASPLSGSYLAPTIVGNATTAVGTATPSQYNTTLTADNAYYRTLVYVVEWQPTLATSTTSGRAFLGTYAVSTAGDHPLQALADFYDDEGHAFPAVEKAVTIVHSYQDMAFKAMTQGNLEAFPTVAFVATGLPLAAQVVGQLTVTRVIELVPRGSSLPRSMAKHTPCDVMACCVAANVIGPNATRGVGSDGYKNASKVGMKIATLAAKALGAYSTGGLMPALMTVLN